MEDLRFTGEGAFVNGYLTIDIWGSSCGCSLYHGACDYYGMHVAHACWLSICQIAEYNCKKLLQESILLK